MNYSYLKSKSFIVPTVLWILFIAIILIALQTGDHKYHGLMRTLIQWDGQHYLSIAREGYEKFPCSYNPTYICGNVGWFPIYPVLGHIAEALTGLDHRVSMLGVSWLALWLALLVLYKLVRRIRDDLIATTSLICLLTFPGSFYFLTAFPYALYLLLAVLSIHFLETGRHYLLMLLCGLLAVTYPSGLVIALPVISTIISRWLQGRSGRSSDQVGFRHFMPLLAIGLALFLYCLYYWWRFDDFFLYLHFQSQSYYAHQIAFPLWTVVRSLVDLPLGSPVSVVLLFITAVTALFYSRGVPFSWQLYMFGILLFTPTLGTTDCYYRHIVVAFPLYVMVASAARSRQRRYLLPLYWLIGVILTWKVFLPAYKTGILM